MFKLSSYWVRGVVVILAILVAIAVVFPLLLVLGTKWMEYLYLRL